MVDDGASPLSGAFRMVRVTPSDIRVYKNVDGHRFGVVFTDEFPMAHGFGGDVWGFGSTVESAIRNLFKLNEEYEALYKGEAIWLVFDGEVPCIPA